MPLKEKTDRKHQISWRPWMDAMRTCIKQINWDCITHQCDKMVRLHRNAKKNNGKCYTHITYKMVTRILMASYEELKNIWSRLLFWWMRNDFVDAVFWRWCRGWIYLYSFAEKMFASLKSLDINGDDLNRHICASTLWI